MSANSPRISIVLSDRNWILERLGNELADRIPGIELRDSPNPSSDINYYMTYACRQSGVSTVEMALFTHMERTPDQKKRFIETAYEVDYSICMSKPYFDILKNAGIKNCTIIEPGIDHKKFDVKVKVGVVGRTYHTGRKGESLVARVMDIPEIEWHFTGDGWPLEGRHVPSESLAEFYRSMDYILVPSFYEGGPMCVPEALAVGTPVIASNVGWVPQFPHIAFKNGDAHDLRRVLNSLIDQKMKLRESTLGYTWDAYAQAHDQVFHSLLNKKTIKLPPPKKSNSATKTRVRLLTHGVEEASLGGPSLRVPRTAEELRALGVLAQASTFRDAESIPEKIVHLFNVWDPHSAIDAITKLKAAGKTVVFSPIYLNLTERAFWQYELPELTKAGVNPKEAYLAYLRHSQGRGRLSEPMQGYNALVREMINMADHIIFLSQFEKDALAAIGVNVENKNSSLVHNPVDSSPWQNGDPDLFRKIYLDEQPKELGYVICVGRIEERKNQLLLAQAIIGLPVKLVLVGHATNTNYLEQIKQVAGEQLILTGRLAPAGPLMKSALRGAHAFVLPSWAEGASLAALEAAAAGASLVLSDRSSEKEYFGKFAQYCDPADPDSIRSAIQSALRSRSKNRKIGQLQRRVRKRYSWETYALKTLKAYGAAAKVHSDKANQKSIKLQQSHVQPVSSTQHNSSGTLELRVGVPFDLTSNEADKVILSTNGWSQSDNGGICIAENAAFLTVKPYLTGQPLPKSLHIHLKYHKIASLSYATDPITISIGDQTAFKMDFKQSAPFTDVVFTVTTDMLDSESQLTLDFLRSPVSSGKFSDLVLKQITISDPAQVNHLQHVEQEELWVDVDEPLYVDFSNQKHRTVFAKNLTYSEAWGAGSKTGKIQVTLPVLPSTHTRTLTLTCRPIASSVRPIYMIIRWNDKIVFDQELRDHQPLEISVLLAESDMSFCAPSILDIEATPLSTPLELEIGSVEHITGLGLMTLSLEPIKK